MLPYVCTTDTGYKTPSTYWDLSGNQSHCLWLKSELITISKTYMWAKQLLWMTDRETMVKSGGLSCIKWLNVHSTIKVLYVQRVMDVGSYRSEIYICSKIHSHVVPADTSDKVILGVEPRPQNKTYNLVIYIVRIKFNLLYIYSR